MIFRASAYAWGAQREMEWSEVDIINKGIFLGGEITHITPRGEMDH